MRKSLFFAILIALFAFSSCSRYKYEQVDGDPSKTRIYTLDNGLKVYLSVNDEQPRIQTFIAVKVGGKNDPAQTTGLAHYFEHLMFKGTEQFGTTDYAAEKPMLDEIERLFEVYRNTTDEEERTAIYSTIDSISYEASKLAIPNEYDKLMSVIGASGTNAFTSTDMTVYTEDIPSNQIENWAIIESDRFRNPVIRLFHTELETIYEEKNMSLTNDSRKVYEAMNAALFPNHPYGKQTVLGTQEHLKNPSITNVKNYHKTYYVPNNMAICMAGDFNPDEVIRIIDKYFGDMQPNPDLPKMEFEPEQPITEPIVRTVYGLESENISIGWRLPGADDKSNDIAQMAGFILSNGTAGLIDLDLLQDQKILTGDGYASILPDYGSFQLFGKPKQGQSLDEVKDLLMAEVDKLRKGEFDDGLIEATVNNLKLSSMNALTSNYSRVMEQTMSFINGESWKDNVETIDRMAKVTKQDIMDWADKYLTPDGYAVIYKRIGKDDNIQKISAPEITPIATNRDKQSEFLTSIQNKPVKEIEPVFVDFSKEMSILDAGSGIDVLYKQNDINDLAYVMFVFDKGVNNDPALSLAFNYLGYLGTADKSAADIAMEMYKLACSFGISASTDETVVRISGLSENIPEAISIVEDLIYNAVPDETILANIKNDMQQRRRNNKMSQAGCFGALQSYMLIGKDAIDRITLNDKELKELTSEKLLAKVHDLMDKQHEILYYGPQSSSELLATLSERHRIADNPEPLKKESLKYLKPGETSKVYLAEYDANQLYYLQYSNRDEKFDYAADPYISLYNEYFGGGMNSIVFQEMREARGLAYTAQAYLADPSTLEDSYMYIAFIATQNDKMQQAIETFEDIINDMPVSQPAFDIAKKAVLSRIRTSRITGDGILWSYRAARELGLDESLQRHMFETIQNLTIDDVIATQQQWVKGRTYDYAILGRTKDLDTGYLKTLGEIEYVSSEDMFGY